MSIVEVFWTVFILVFALAAIGVTRGTTRRVVTLLFLLGAIVGLLGCGGSSAPATTAAPATSAQHWVSSWCKVKLTDSRSDVTARMGPPTRTSAAQDSWSGFGYSFTTFYDERGAIQQLYSNDVDLTAAQKSRIRCPSGRS